MPDSIVACDVFSCSSIISVPADKTYDAATITARGWKLGGPPKFPTETHLCPKHLDATLTDVF